MILIYKGNSTALFLHNCVICLSKSSLLSASSPSSLTLFSELMFISFIFIEVGYFVSFFLSIIMVWNLSGFPIIMFFFNHCTAFSESEVKFSISSSEDFSVHEIVLPSTKLCNSAFSIRSKRSLMKILKRIGPKINPCGNPDNKTTCIIYLHILFSTL